MTDKETWNDEQTREITILVDADATPKDAVLTADKLAGEYGCSVVTVSTFNHHYDRPNHIMVDPHPQAVDMVILSRIRGDNPYIVVTQDYGLAALALGQGAEAVSPKGLIYTNDNIDRLLMERDLNAKARRMTGRAKGPAARTPQDAHHFAESLEAVLRKLRT